jgi:hypothetical protein
VGFSIKLFDKLYWFYIFTLTINCSTFYQTNENLMLLKKLCKINKGKFGKKKLMILIIVKGSYKKQQIFCQTSSYEKGNMSITNMRICENDLILN